MNIFCAENVEISSKRYSELIASEERLRLLEQAIKSMSEYDVIKPIKQVFCLTEKGETENETL